MKRVWGTLLSLLLLTGDGARSGRGPRHIRPVGHSGGRGFGPGSLCPQRRGRAAIASTTKLMTALVAVESTPELDAVFTIRREWTGIEGSSMYLKAGEQLTLWSCSAA